MASGTTRLSDVIVPAVFTGYKQNITKEKSALIASGAVVSDPFMDGLLSGPGLTYNVPSFKDLDSSDAENISSDDPTVKSTPNKIGTLQEIAVRLSRNNSWSSMDLNTALIVEDPLQAIASRIGYYWARRLQAAFIATMNGIFAMQATASGTGGSTHVQNDMTRDIKGASFSAGVTNFSAGAFIDAALTMGDAEEDLGMVMMHSIVYGTALKNNLITFLTPSNNAAAQKIPYFLGRRVIVDDGMPNPSTGVYETWLFGPGALRLGMGTPKVPTEVFRDPSSGNGSGQETLWDRVEWLLHPAGHAYAGTAPNGGPTNAATTNNLAAAASWKRVYPERKQIPIARLVTREF